jgi:hypothetical protein
LAQTGKSRYLLKQQNRGFDTFFPKRPSYKQELLEKILIGPSLFTFDELRIILKIRKNLQFDLFTP